MSAGAVLLESEDVSLRDSRARSLVDRGDLGAAFNEWASVLQVAPGHVGAIKGMAFVRFRQGLHAEAERLLLQAQAHDADPAIAAAISTVRETGSGTFQSFVSDIATTIAQHLAVAEAREAREAKRAPAATARPGRAFVVDREKVVMHWPDLAARVSEEG